MHDRKRVELMRMLLALVALLTEIKVAAGVAVIAIAVLDLPHTLENDRALQVHTALHVYSHKR